MTRSKEARADSRGRDEVQQNICNLQMSLFGQVILTL